MRKKTFTPEQIAGKLRQIECVILRVQGKESLGFESRREFRPYSLRRFQRIRLGL